MLVNIKKRLVSEGLASSFIQAKKLIAQGVVSVNGKRVVSQNLWVGSDGIVEVRKGV